MLNYSVRFDPKHGYYRARFWERGIGYDSYVKVPDEFWQELGYEPPRAEPQDDRQRRNLEKFALGWAATERDRREKQIRAEHEGRRADAMTLRQVWELYKTENPKRVSPETLNRDRISFDAIVRHKDVIDVDRHTPEDVDEPMIVGLRNALEADTVRRKNTDGKVVDVPLRHRSINNVLEFLLRLLHFSLRWQSKTGVKGLRANSVEMLPDQASTQVALTPEQVGELLKHAKGWKRQVIIFGICSRLREENLLSLDASWISWPNKWLHIPAEFMKKGRARAAHELSIPLPEIALSQIGNPKIKGKVWVNAETGLPFTKAVGLDRLARLAGIPEFSLHDLRTTGITWLRMNKIDPLVIKVLAGHTTLRDESGQSFTVKTGDVTDLYTKVFVEQLREAMAVYDRIFARILNPQIKVVQMADRV